MKQRDGRSMTKIDFPLRELPASWTRDEKRLCAPILAQDIFDFRYAPRGELTQALLNAEEREKEWFDQLGLTPLRTVSKPKSGGRLDSL